MVEFTLPANSKVQKGINHPIKEVSEDKKVMNRNSLFEVSKKLILENKDFTPPKECSFNLSGKPLKEKI